jgi:hypothetical protein
MGVLYLLVFLYARVYPFPCLYFSPCFLSHFILIFLTRLSRLSGIESRWGHALAQLFEALLRPGRSRVRFPMVSLEFFIDIILPAALWPWD